MATTVNFSPSPTFIFIFTPSSLNKRPVIGQNNGVIILRARPQLSQAISDESLAHQYRAELPLGASAASLPPALPSTWPALCTVQTVFWRLCDGSNCILSLFIGLFCSVPWKRIEEFRAVSPSHIEPVRSEKDKLQASKCIFLNT